MMNLALFINQLKSVDIVFFIVCAALVVIGVGVYFLIPVLNKKQYQEQRDNLRKREEAFKSNLSVNAQADAEKVEDKDPAQNQEDN